MRKAKPFATITLTLFKADGETAVLIDPQGDLPREPASYTQLLQELATALQDHAHNIAHLSRAKP